MTSASDQFPPTRPLRSSELSLRDATLLQTGLLRESANEEADDSVDFRALLRIALKHKWLIVSVMSLCLAAALVKTLTSTPLYRASATLHIDRASAKIVLFNKDTVPTEDDSDYMAQQTQVELLRSRAMAERVIDDLNLDPTRGKGVQPGVLGGVPVSEVVTPPATAASKAVDSSFWSGIMDMVTRTIQGYERMGKPAVTDRQVLGRAAIVGSVMGSVKIEPVKNTRLVRIHVVSGDPAKAALIANGFANSFIAMTMERRIEASSYARTFLEDQIKVTKARLEESERTLNEYTRVNSILTLDDKNTAISQTFNEYSAALGKVEQDRLKLEAQYSEMVRSPDAAPQVLDSKAVQTFKEQKAKIEAEYLINLGTYKPDFPKMVQAKAQIAELEMRIKAEMAAVLASTKAQYDALKRQEDQVRARLLDTRKEVLLTQDRGVNMNLLKRELETNRQIYDNLLQRLKEVGVVSGVTTNNISVVDAATTPLFPFKPDIMANALVGLGVGLALSLAFIFVREKLDDSVKHADELEAKFGLPLLGIIPQVKKSKLPTDSLARLTVDDPRGAFAEAYRSMRTALQFSTTEGAPKRMMVTSSVKGEGKSTTALALAINFAQMGKRVLLVDADMRNPSAHEGVDLVNDRGLSNYLSGEGTRESLIRASAVANLHVMTAGPMPPSPVDLLMGPKLLRLLDKAEEMGFDHVVIDAPPILGIADALVLGNQIQSILFVVKAGTTRRASIKDALRRLRTAGLVPLGMALTRASSHHSAYYGYEGYYGYGYNEKPSDKNKEKGKDRDAGADERLDHAAA